MSGRGEDRIPGGAVGGGPPAEPDTPHSQTLDRGIRVLEALASADGGLSIAELARALGVHRSIVYRILRTLEAHRLVRRDAEGRARLDLGLSALARGVSARLQDAALPELSAVANELGMTAFVVVADRGEAVTLATVEPRSSAAHVSYRPGVRHPLDRGAPGLALLAGAPARSGERAEVEAGRRRGWTSSRGEVIPGLSSVAVPVRGGSVDEAVALAVVYVDEDASEADLAARLRVAADAVADALR